MKTKALITALLLTIFTISFAAKVKLSSDANKDLRNARLKFKVERKLEEALVDFQSVLNEDPNHLEALKVSADIHYYLAEPDADDPDYGNKELTVSKKIENFSKARVLFIRYIEAANAEKKLSKEEKKWLLDSEKFAESCWVKIFKIGQDKYNEEDFETSENIFLQLDELVPNRKETLFYLYNIFITKQNQEKAVEYAKKLLEFEPNNKQLLAQIALYYVEKKEHETALQYMDVIIENYPTDIDNIFNKAIILLEMGKKKEAYDTFLRVTEVDKNNVEALIEAANISWSEGDMQDVIELYNRIIMIDMSNPAYFQNLVVFMNREKMYKELIPYAVKWFDMTTNQEDKKTAAQILIYAAQQIQDDKTVAKYSEILGKMQK
ncbi:MAG: tetratricopeptide repeat protein [Candidatus Cloacimonetes bacterium]|nr:tetratricopeptide repeat protein [Candidatus Cloacimonadota bacterium]